MRLEVFFVSLSNSLLVPIQKPFIVVRREESE
jgi:hypothetical protein